MGPSHFNSIIKLPYFKNNIAIIELKNNNTKKMFCSIVQNRICENRGKMSFSVNHCGKEPRHYILNEQEPMEHEC